MNRKEGRKIHFLPPYSCHHYLLISKAKKSPGEVTSGFNLFPDGNVAPEKESMGGHQYIYVDED